VPAKKVLGDPGDIGIETNAKEGSLFPDKGD
jgi:hypothetical protein